MNTVFEDDEFQVRKVVTGTVWRQNCYLVVEKRAQQLALVDPGGDAERLCEAVEQSGGRLTHILLTHGHHDHIGALAEVAGRFELPGLLHKLDAKLARRAQNYALIFHNQRIFAPQPLLLFDDGAEFRMGRRTVQAQWMPGHTEGSVSFRVGGCVLTGDTLLFEKVGRTDLPGGDADAIRRSLEGLLDLAPNTLVLPGHGQPWTIDSARHWWRSQTSPLAAGEAVG